MYKLKYLAAKFNNSPTYLSPEWHASRKYNLGGSEIGSVCGQNKYRNRDDVKTTKTTNHREEMTDEVKTLCEWGHLFEDVCKTYLTKHKGMVIYDSNGIPNSTIPICYSPDGFLVDGDDLILIEIKSPVRASSRKIKDDYMYQVQSGLMTLPCDHAMFINNKFRKCKLKNLRYDGYYDRRYHFDSWKCHPRSSSVYTGVVVWNKDVKKVHGAQSAGNNIDIGGVGADQFRLPDCYNYDKLLINPTNDELADIRDKVILPFKCLEMNMTKVLHDPDIQHKIRVDAWSFQKEATEEQENQTEDIGIKKICEVLDKYKYKPRQLT